MSYATVVSVRPRMADGVHDTWTSGDGTVFYKFEVHLDNGQSGIAKGMTPTLRFSAGDQVIVKEFKPSTNPKFPLGTLKLERPKDGPAPVGATARGGAQTTTAGYALPATKSSGWSPEKEASVMIQGLLKSVIESGVEKNQWHQYLSEAMALHDTLLATRVSGKPKLNYKPEGHVDGVHQGVPGTGIMEESDAPF